jgi:hypothetical protein
LANMVTLSFTANETISTPTVTLLGVPATVENPAVTIGRPWQPLAQARCKVLLCLQFQRMISRAMPPLRFKRRPTVAAWWWTRPCRA